MSDHPLPDAREALATPLDWMPEALQAAAQCWCDPETSDREMDSALAHAVARRIAAWMSTAAQFGRDVEFYRGLLDDCAKHLGPAVFTSDDGSVQVSPVRLKIPELVAALSADHARWQRDVVELDVALAEREARIAQLASAARALLARADSHASWRNAYAHAECDELRVALADPPPTEAS